MQIARHLGRAVTGATELRDRLQHEWLSATAFLSAKPCAAYVGWVGYQNLGDEILFQAHKQLFPDMTLLVYRKSILLRLLSTLAGRRPYDCGILGGGTLINQHHRWLTAVQELEQSHVPMLCLGTGVASVDFWTINDEDRHHLGHDQNELSEWVKSLRKFSYVGVRGPYSCNSLQRSGLRGATVVGDTALSLRHQPVVRTESSASAIGVSVGYEESNPMWGDPLEYLSEVVDFIRSMCTSGCQVHLLPVARRDVPSNLAILDLVDHKQCRMILAFDTYENYSSAVLDCDLFVGQKLHATVVACMNRIPSLMIEYRPKCRDFMASLDLEEYVIRTDEFTSQTATSMVNRLSRERGNVLARIDKGISRYGQEQKETAKRLSELILHNPAI